MISIANIGGALFVMSFSKILLVKNKTKTKPMSFSKILLKPKPKIIEHIPLHVAGRASSQPTSTKVSTNQNKYNAPNVSSYRPGAELLLVGQAPWLKQKKETVQMS